jgi:hypothetical protein
MWCMYSGTYTVRMRATTPWYTAWQHYAIASVDAWEHQALRGCAAYYAYMQAVASTTIYRCMCTVRCVVASTVHEHHMLCNRSIRGALCVLAGHQQVLRGCRSTRSNTASHALLCTASTRSTCSTRASYLSILAHPHAVMIDTVRGGP